MPRKPNYRFEKRRKEEARQRRKAEKQNSKQAKRTDAEQVEDNQPQAEDASTAPP